MSLNFNLSQEHTLLVDAIGDALRPWTDERKQELRAMVEHAVFPTELWQTFSGLLKTAPVSKEMILNFIAEFDLGLPKSY